MFTIVYVELIQLGIRIFYFGLRSFNFQGAKLKKKKNHQMLQIIQAYFRTYNLLTIENSSLSQYKV